MPIPAIRFYHKDLRTVVPLNNILADASSSDEDEVPAKSNSSQRTSKNRVLKLAGEDEESSDESESRWAKTCSRDSTVILGGL